MQRPCVELLDVNLHVAKLTSFGMPSAHSANMACIAAVFLWLCPRLGYVWGGIALLTGISRIYVGVHYPSQVLVGWTVGAAVGTIGVLIYKQILKRRISESPAEVP